MPKPVEGMPPLRFMDRDFLRNIRAALNSWEEVSRGAREPDELLDECLGAVKWGRHARWPSKDLVREVKSILLKMGHPSIVKSVAIRFGMSEREAFWLCLGLGMGGKVLIDMFTAGVESIDEAISTT
jgi:hypothetical protein